MNFAQHTHTPGATSPCGKELARTLSRRYFYALGAVAFLVILDQLVVQPALIRLAFDAPVINVAGRQRMLSQKLTKAALAMHLVSLPGEDFSPTDFELRRQELLAAAELWSQAHHGLQNGDDSLSLPPNDNPTIEAEFARLEPHFQTMQLSVKTISQELQSHSQQPVSPRIQTAITPLLDHEAQYLPVMDKIVGMFEQDARARVIHLRVTGWSIVVAILLLLVGVGMFVTCPAARVIQRQFQELAQQEQQYRLLVDRMSDGLAVYQRNGKLIYANDRFCTMLGRSRQELLHRPIASLTTPDSRDRLYQLIPWKPDDHISSADICWSVSHGGTLETQVSTGIGPALISQELSPVENQPQEETLVSVITDISERKRMEVALQMAHDVLEQRVIERTRQLSEANRALEHEIDERISIEAKSRQLRDQLAHSTRLNTVGQLATGLAHELNQPLGSISNYAEGSLYLLEKEASHPWGKELPDQFALQESLTRIRDAAMRAGAIIRRLRRLVRNRPSEKVPVEINSLIQEVCELLSTELTSHDVRIQLQLTPDLPLVKADPIQLQQVLVNLLQNAIQAMKSTPRSQRGIHIQTEQPGEMLEITVRDTGEGFPPDQADSLFQAFTTTKPHGLGMGLTISRSIIQEHGGKLWGNSEPGAGATLRFSIPVACRETVST